jgi:hypothetical protein
MLTRLTWCSCKTEANVEREGGGQSGALHNWSQSQHRMFLFPCEANFAKASIFLSIIHGEKLFLLFALFVRFFGIMNISV